MFATSYNKTFLESFSFCFAEFAYYSALSMASCSVLDGSKSVKFFVLICFMEIFSPPTVRSKVLAVFAEHVEAS